MHKDNEERDRLIAKFRKIRTKSGTPFSDMKGGIFTPRTRKKLLDIVKQSEPGMSANQFWYDRRNDVERALIDLRLFLEVAGKDNIDQVITQESLRFVVYALLWHQLFAEGPNMNQAEIAQLLIEQGFSYMSGMFDFGSRRLPLSSQRTIEEAVDLSKYIVFQVEDLKRAAEEKKELFERLGLTKATRKSRVRQ